MGATIHLPLGKQLVLEVAQGHHFLPNINRETGKNVRISHSIHELIIVLSKILHTTALYKTMAS